MDLYESMKKIQEKGNQNNIEKYAEMSIKIAEQGFDKKSITDILRSEGCEKEQAKKLALSALDEVPYQFYLLDPPNCFDDLSDQIQERIKKASIEKIEEYFDKYQNKNLDNIKNDIIIAKNNESDNYYKEAMISLRPFIEDLIIAGKSLAGLESKNDYLDHKEKLEQDLFGVWPVFLIQKRAIIDNADKKIINRSDVKPGDNISFI